MRNRGTRLLWGLFVASSALYFLSDLEADNDLWVHVLIGQIIESSGTVPTQDTLSYTAAGTTWVDHEWLTHIAFARLFDQGGSTALWGFKVCLGMVSALFLWLGVRRRTDQPMIWGAVTLMSLAVLSRGFATRPQVVSYAAIALLLWILDRCDAPHDRGGGARRPGAPAEGSPGLVAMLAVTLLSLFWVNAHGAFVLGLAILALYAAVPPWRVRRFAMLPLVVLASCINPYGPRLLLYLREELTVPHPLTEWQPAWPTDPAHLPFYLLLLLFLATVPFAARGRRSPWRILLAAAVGVMAIRHQRHTPVFALCVAAPLAAQIEALVEVARQRGMTLSRFTVWVVPLAVALLATAQIVLLAARLSGTGLRIHYSPAEYPLGALTYLQRTGVRGNLALPLEWGAYALWHASDRFRVSLDGRFVTAYPPEVIEACFDFLYGTPEQATRFLERFPTDAVLVSSTQHATIRRIPGWHLRYRDAVAEVHLPSPGPVVRGAVPPSPLPFP